MTESREARQARAAAGLRDAARRRHEAKQALEQAMGHVRDSVLAARAAGVTVRRSAELGEVSPDTVNEWTQAARAEALAHVRNRMEQAADPRRRGAYLGWRFTTTWVPNGEDAGHPKVPLFTENPLDRTAILQAAYEAVLTDRPGLAPDMELAQAAATAAVASADSAPPAVWMRDVIAACNPAPVDAVMADLDLAARLLLAGPRESWQAALLPALEHRSPGRSTFAGVIGARQTLDTLLAPARGGYAPGTAVTLADGSHAMVTQAHWDPETRQLIGYQVTPDQVGLTETTVPAEQITGPAGVEQ